MNKDATKLERWKSRLFNSVLLGGVVGGVVFAAVSPFFLPGMTGLMADNMGDFVGEPNIEAEVQGRSPILIPENKTENYTINIQNIENRVAEDVRVTFYFKGCPVDRGFRAVDGEKFAHPGIEFGNTSRCVETVYIPDLAKGEELTLQYTVKGTNRTDLPAIPMIAIGEDHELAYRADTSGD